MKTASVADLRNNFRRVSNWIEHGETVEITKRGKPFAQLSAIGGPRRSKSKKVDFMAQLREIWGAKVFTAEEVRAMREAELEGEEG
jgi:antitoxin (DNA-binding transcriptional repressor) of toxin-antitoxin stability system